MARGAVAVDAAARICRRYRAARVDGRLAGDPVRSRSRGCATGGCRTGRAGTPHARPSRRAEARPEAERPAPGPADPAQPPSRPGPPTLPTPSFATLILTVGGGERGQEAGRPPTLVIPPGTADVRLQLRLREPSTRATRSWCGAIGGPEILRRADLRPASRGIGCACSPSVVPASRFTAGDYMLTLQGAAGGGELDDLSQSLFRVESSLTPCHFHPAIAESRAHRLTRRLPVPAIGLAALHH